MKEYKTSRRDLKNNSVAGAAVGSLGVLSGQVGPAAAGGGGARESVAPILHQFTTLLSAGIMKTRCKQ